MKINSFGIVLCTVFIKVNFKSLEDINTAESWKVLKIEISKRNLICLLGALPSRVGYFEWRR